MRIRFSSHNSVRPSRRSWRMAPVGSAPALALVPAASNRRSTRSGLRAARGVSLALALCTPLCAGALLAGPGYAAPVNQTDENGPIVAILRPAYNDVLKGTIRILISVTARKYNPQSIEMFIDDVPATKGPLPLSSFVSSSYDFDTRKFGDGPHKLMVRVTDTQGFRGWSEVQIFINNGQIVDAAPPSLKWKDVEPFQTFSGSSKIEIEGADNFGIKMLIISLTAATPGTDGKTASIASWALNRPPYRVNLDSIGLKVPDGLYSLKALAYDSLEQQGDAPPLTIGIVNNPLNATTVGEMLDGRREMADAIAGRTGADKPQPAKVQPPQAKTNATVVTPPRVFDPPTTNVTKVTPLKADPPKAQDRPLNVTPYPTPDVPKVNLPEETATNPGIAVPKVTLPPASTQTSDAERARDAAQVRINEFNSDAPTTSTAPEPAEDPKRLTFPIPVEDLPGAGIVAKQPDAIVQDPIKTDPNNGSTPVKQIPTISTPGTGAVTDAAETTEATPETGKTADTDATKATDVDKRPEAPTGEPVPANNAPKVPDVSAQTMTDAEREKLKREQALANGVRQPAVGHRYGAASLSRRTETLDARIALGQSAKASAPSVARASEARLSLPAFAARSVLSAPAWSQSLHRDDSRATQANIKVSGAMRAQFARVVAAQVKRETPQLLGASAPSLIERAVSQPKPKIVTKTGAPNRAGSRTTKGKITQAVQKSGRAQPIEIKPATIHNGAIAPATPNRVPTLSAPTLSVPTQPRIAGGGPLLGAPSPLTKAVPRTNVAPKNPRLSALPRSNSASSNGNGVAAITAVPMTQPLQTAAASDVPANYRIERTTTLRAVAAHFGLPVELVALSNDWPTEMKLVKGMNVKLPRPLQVSYNGAPVASDAPSMLLGDTAVTAFRFLFEQSGGSLKWDAAKQRVVARKGGQEITLDIGSKIAKVGDREVMMELAAFLFEGRTMVPLRFFEESLNAQVEWDPQTGRLVVAMIG